MADVAFSRARYGLLADIADRLVVAGDIRGEAWLYLEGTDEFADVRKAVAELVGAGWAELDDSGVYVLTGLGRQHLDEGLP